MRKRRHFLFSFCAGALIAFFLALAGRESLAPFDRDEARYMQASLQMAQTDDFIRIFFQETPRNHQPAGLYWLEAGSLKFFGLIAGDEKKIQKNPFIYRFPALIASSFTGGLTALLGDFLFASGFIGVLGTLILSVSVLFSLESRLATPDPCLLALIMAQMLLLAQIMRQQAEMQKTSKKISLFYWGLMGAGLLIKGPIILLSALLTPLALSLTGNGKDIWQRLRPWGILFSALIAAPWYIAIYMKTNGAFFEFALKHNFLGKVVGGQETHGFLPGYYLVIFLLAFWPGSYFFVRSLGEIKQYWQVWQVRFLCCWIVPLWIVFESVPTKLPHYLLPVYPAIALLTSYFTVSASNVSPKGRWFYFPYGMIWGLLSLSLPAALLFVLLQEKAPLSAFLLIFATLAFIGIGCSLFWLWRGKILLALGASLLGAFLLETGIYCGAMPVLPPFHVSEKAADIFNQLKTCSTARLISLSYKEPSLVFLAGGDRVLLTGPYKALELLEKPESCDMLLLDKKREGNALDLLKEEGLTLREVAQLSAQNYSNGHKMDLRFYQK